MSNAKASGKADSGEKLIASNPHVGSNYFISELVEAGMALTGTEIKSMRNEAPNLRDAFVEVNGKLGSMEAWLVNAHIGPYTHGNIWNHEERRRRKLLLHRHQIDRMFGAIKRDGMTIIPTRMYFKKGRAKIELAVAKGKKKHDKRQDLKKRSAQREIDQVMKKGR
jgi:SsrA-binding protein